MLKLLFAVIISASSIWSTTMVVGPTRTYSTLATAIQSKLPLTSDLVIYLEVPSLQYATAHALVPTPDWNGNRVIVHGVKYAPEITGYVDQGDVYEFIGDKMQLTHENVIGAKGVESRFEGQNHIVYFEDHLGSTRMTMNEGGSVLEGTMYYSYGRATEFSVPAVMTRNKFTGKEMDKDGADGVASGINLDYFGARFYDPELAMWISPDAERQFDTPYLYAGNDINSIIGFDEDGNKLVVDGDVIFKARVIIDLNKIIAGGPKGKTLVDQLKNSKNIFTVTQVRGGNQVVADNYRDASYGVGSGATIKFNPTKTTGGTDAKGSNIRPTFIGLAHELQHAAEMDLGIFPRTNIVDPKTGIPRWEKSAIKKENEIRKENKIPKRVGY